MQAKATGGSWSAGGRQPEPEWPPPTRASGDSSKTWTWPAFTYTHTHTERLTEITCRSYYNNIASFNVLIRFTFSIAVSLCFRDMLEWIHAAFSLGGIPESWEKMTSTSDIYRLSTDTRSTLKTLCSYISITPLNKYHIIFTIQNIHASTLSIRFQLNREPYMPLIRIS